MFRLWIICRLVSVTASNYLIVKLPNLLIQVTDRSTSSRHTASQKQLKNRTFATNNSLDIYSERNGNTGALTSELATTLRIRFRLYTGIHNERESPSFDCAKYSLAATAIYVTKNTHCVTP